MDEKRWLSNVSDILYAEYDVLRMMEDELRDRGKIFVADSISDSKKSLAQVIHEIEISLKIIEDDKTFEQLKMDI